MRGIPALAVAYGLAAGANLLLTTTVGHQLGAAALGSFALAMAVGRIFYAATDLGVATQVAREHAAQRAHAADRSARYLGLRIALIPFGVVIAVCAGLVHDPDQVLCFLFVAIALGMVSLQGLYEALLLARDRSRVVATLTLLSSGALVLACSVAVATRGGLTAIAALYAAATVTGVIAWARWTGNRLGIWPRLTGRIASLRTDLALPWEIGASTLLAIAALRAPTVILSIFESKVDVGTFAAVDMLVVAPGIVQAAVTNASFPRLAASYRADPTAYRATFWRSNAILAATGVLLGAAVALAGPHVLRLLFPSRDFARIDDILPLSAWSLPALLLVHHNISVFAAAGRERANLHLMFLWFSTIFVLQLALVPPLGLIGSAWALLVARTLGLGALVIAILATGVHASRRVDDEAR